jgi:hypothetical protein
MRCLAGSGPGWRRARPVSRLIERRARRNEGAAFASTPPLPPRDLRRTARQSSSRPLGKGRRVPFLPIPGPQGARWRAGGRGAGTAAWRRRQGESGGCGSRCCSLLGAKRSRGHPRPHAPCSHPPPASALFFVLAAVDPWVAPATSLAPSALPNPSYVPSSPPAALTPPALPPPASKPKNTTGKSSSNHG